MAYQEANPIETRDARSDGRTKPAAKAGGERPANFEPDRQSADPAFLADIKAIRDRARRDMDEGAVTAGYGKDREQAVQVLNAALATEIICVLRYKRHAFTAVGIYSEPIAKEFAVHAAEEQAHADQIAERIVQLGGKPDFSPDGLSGRAHADYVECSTLKEMIQENLVAERIAVETYREMARWFGDDDPTTKRMIEGILAQEEEHADELADLLQHNAL